MKRTFLLLCLLLCAFATASAQYTFTLIQFPDANQTTARGINNHGDIAGAYRITPPRHAMIYQDGVFSPFLPDAEPGWGYSEAFKINDRGDVAGYWSDDYGYRGFLYRKGLFTDIVYPNASNTQIYGMNNLATVVGTWDFYDPDGNLLEYHGFIWKDGTFTDFNVPGSGNTSLIGINNRGDIVGMYDAGITDPTGHGSDEAYGYDDFPAADVVLTQGNDISENGVIVGTYMTSDGTQHGMIVEGATFTTLDYPGSAFTSLWGINNAGQIVGTTRINGVPYGFLAQPGNKKKTM
jgi:uncharacterized membrane protein